MMFTIPILFVLGLKFDGGPPTSSVYYDQQIISDAFRLRVDQLRKSGKLWVIGEIMPKRTRVGEVIPLDEFKLRSEPDHRETGVFQVSVILNGTTTKRDSTYDWDSRRYSIRGILQSPFDFGGTVVCNWQPDSVGRDQFPAVHLVAPEWVASLRLATEWFASNTLPEASEKNKLSALANNGNLWIAISAWRSIVEKNSPDSRLVSEALGETSFYRQAAIAFMLLCNRSDDQIQNSADVLAKLVASAKSTEDFRGIAAAAVLADRVQRAPTVRAACRMVISAAEARHRVVGRQERADAYVRELFRIAAGGGLPMGTGP